MTEPSDPSTGDPNAAGPDSSADPGADLAALQARLADAETRALAARDAQMRTLADMDNLRKRTDREVQQARQYGSEKLLGELLGVADSLDLGLAAASKPDAQVATIVEGMQLTRRQLVSTLEKHGVKLVDPAGEPFNPDLHEAVTMVESAQVPPNHVVTVMQKGYRLHDRLLRPAMVVVGKAPAAPAP